MKTGSAFGRWVKICVVTVLLMSIPVAAAGPEGQEVCTYVGCYA